jgi:transposase
LWLAVAVRDNDGRKLDHKTLEAMRIRAVRQIEAGARVEDVAAVLGLSRSAVFSWVAQYREGGVAALVAKPVPGRPMKLSGEQLARVYALVVGHDPRQLQFEFGLWTREMVRMLIRREFGVGLSVVSVGRLLKKLGLSPQRPLWRAYQQDPAAVEAWRRDQFPAIRAEAARCGATVFFADEAGIRSDYHAGTTWAPIGQTPVVASTGRRHQVNLISAVSAKGGLRFAAFTGRFTAAVFIDFCKRLMHAAGGAPVFLVVDGHPVHRSKAVAEFVASTDGRLRLFRLPGYAPELNPDEWVWKHVKHDRLGRAGLGDGEDLRMKALAALHRLQKLPRIIRGFFADPNLAYITA